MDLSAEVKGYMLIKKLKLDSAAQTMILTATHGVLTFKEVTDACESNLPGRERDCKREEQSDSSGEYHEEEDKVLEAIEAIAEEWHRRDDIEDEDVLEAFESCSEIRRKTAEKRKARGFGGGSAEPQKCRLSGSVTGRIQKLKAKTPLQAARTLEKRTSKSPEKKAMGSPLAPELAVRHHRRDVGRKRWSLRRMTQGTRTCTSPRVRKRGSFSKKSSSSGRKRQTAEAVQNAGFADTHVTGNRQRPVDGISVAGNVSRNSPAQAIWADFWEVDQEKRNLRRVHVVTRMSLFRLESVP